MAELISAKDLPITEAEEVDVLCVENGEMKRKPAKGLGGGGYILKLPLSGIQDPAASPITIVVADNYDDFAPIIFAGGTVALDVSELAALTEDFPSGSRGIGYFQFAGIVPGMGFVGMFNLLSMEFQVVALNGTWTPPAV